MISTMPTTTTTTTKSPEMLVAPNLRYSIVAPDGAIERAAKALEQHGMHTIVVDNAAQAQEQVLKLVPHGAHVYTTTSRTLEDTGISAALNDSDNYRSIRKLVYGMNRETEMREIRKLQGTHDYVVGSVHAVTETGAVLVASGGGSAAAKLCLWRRQGNLGRGRAKNRQGH